MATFVHITDEKLARRIQRGGLRSDKISAHDRGVFCVPVLQNFQITFQWLRELKRRGNRTAVAIQFRIPDDEPVLFGHYGQELTLLSAVNAVSAFSTHTDPRGLQIIVRRSISQNEIHRIRALPQFLGWRYYPNAQGKFPAWIPPGSIKGKKARSRQQTRYESQ